MVMMVIMIMGIAGGQVGRPRAFGARPHPNPSPADGRGAQARKWGGSGAGGQRHIVTGCGAVPGWTASGFPGRFS